jgi:chorismate-pyruvate lyase
LLDLFSESIDRPECVLTPASAVPTPYDRLLVHRHHMTVTVEEFYGDSVDVRILDLNLTEQWYARKILLTKRSDGKIVQFGIARIRLQFCAAPVRKAILEGKTPLGRILIEHNVHRRIEPIAFMRVPPGVATETWFGSEAGRHVTYGRIGVIYCDEQPAIEVLEIVAPVLEPPQD